MDEPERSDEEMRGLIERLHPIPKNQDGNCPHIVWMGEDLTQCPGIGEWKCMLQDDSYGDLLCGGGKENLDYKPCNHSNHNECHFYIKNKS
jgi:hypothetical protein